MMINPSMTINGNLTYRGSQGQFLNGASSYTYTNAPIGTASSDRYVYVVTWFREDGGGINLSCTIGGVSATKIIGDITDSLGFSKGAIFALNVPAGTTSTVIVSAGIATNEQMMAVYTGTGLNKPLNPLNTYSVNTASVPLSLNISSPPQGFFLGGMGTSDSITTFTVSNAKKDYTVQGVSSTLTGASTMNTGPYTVTITPATSQNRQAFFGITLR